MPTAKECARLTEFLGIAKPLCRDFRTIRRSDGLLGGAGTLRTADDPAAQPLGVEGSRQQIVDRHAASRHATSDSRDESRKTGACTARQVETLKRHLDAERSDVDDATKAPLRHSIQHFLDQLDRGQHIGCHAGEHRFAVQFPKVAKGRPTVVVDQDIGRRAGGEQCTLALRRTDIGGNRNHIDVPAASDLKGSRLELLYVAAVDCDRDAGLGKGHGTTAAQSFTGCADDGLATAYSQIHWRRLPDSVRIEHMPRPRTLRRAGAQPPNGRSSAREMMCR